MKLEVQITIDERKYNIEIENFPIIIFFTKSKRQVLSLIKNNQNIIKEKSLKNSISALLERSNQENTQSINIDTLIFTFRDSKQREKNVKDFLLEVISTIRIPLINCFVQQISEKLDKQKWRETLSLILTPVIEKYLIKEYKELGETATQGTDIFVSEISLFLLKLFNESSEMTEVDSKQITFYQILDEHELMEVEELIRNIKNELYSNNDEKKGLNSKLFELKEKYQIINKKYDKIIKEEIEELSKNITDLRAIVKKHCDQIESISKGKTDEYFTVENLNLLTQNILERISPTIGDVEIEIGLLKKIVKKTQVSYEEDVKKVSKAKLREVIETLIKESENSVAEKIEDIEDLVNELFNSKGTIGTPKYHSNKKNIDIKYLNQHYGFYHKSSYSSGGYSLFWVSKQNHNQLVAIGKHSDVPTKAFNKDASYKLLIVSENLETGNQNYIGYLN